MDHRTVLLSLMSMFLMLALVAPGSAQARTIGVSKGSSFTYSLTVSWVSNDPKSTPPPYMETANDTLWAQFNVTDVSGTNITVQATTHYKNGTETTGEGWLDVDTGFVMNVAYIFISANLTAGESVYGYTPYDTWIINQTLPRTYPSGVRETNYLNIITSYAAITFRNYYFWDKLTGVLVELQQDGYNQTGVYTTTSSFDLKVTGSNVWTVPEFPTWTAPLLMLVALTSATALTAERRRRPKRPLG